MCIINTSRHTPERLFYFEQEGKLFVCEIAFHNYNTYEQFRKGYILKELF